MASLTLNGANISGQVVPYGPVRVVASDQVRLDGYRVSVPGAADSTAPAMTEVAPGRWEASFTLDITGASPGPVTLRERFTVGGKAYDYSTKVANAAYEVLAFTEVRRYASEADVPADVADASSGVLAVVP